jgi:hypothetical protein
MNRNGDVTEGLDKVVFAQGVDMSHESPSMGKRPMVETIMSL